MSPDLLIEIGLWLIALSVLAAGVVGIVFPAIPGPPLMFAGLWMMAWIEEFVHVGLWTLVLLGVLAALAQAADFLAGALGAKKFGASPRAVLLSTVGAIVGIFFGIFGLILGPFVGAMVGELTSGRSMQEASRAGVGATVGLVVGIGAKIAFGIAMLAIFAFVRLV